MDTNDKTTAPSAEQAADFAALQAAANEASAGPPVGGEAVPVPNLDLAHELEGLIKVAVATLAPIFPSLRETYTPEVTTAAAGAIAAVCNKHGWMQGGMFGEWGEEIACAAIVGPLALTTYQGITQDMARAKAQAKQREAERISAPAAPVSVTDTGPTPSKGVVFGAPIPVPEGGGE